MSAMIYINDFFFAIHTHLCMQHRIAKVAVGRAHILCVSVDNVVFAWGNNDHGQLGLGHTDPVLEATVITSISGKSIVDVRVNVICILLQR
jgi:alpha-tubulin suppressor-like RCC1 family protein